VGKFKLIFAGAGIDPPRRFSLRLVQFAFEAADFVFQPQFLLLEVGYQQIVGMGPVDFFLDGFIDAVMLVKQLGKMHVKRHSNLRSGRQRNSSPRTQNRHVVIKPQNRAAC
jgi:hypothetical protein